MSLSLLRRVTAIALLLTLAGLTAAFGQSPGDLYHAYYLEREKSDYAGAARLWEGLLSAPGADGEIRALAQQHLTICREELATADLARLIPPNPAAYVELNRPGERFRDLLNQLGLLTMDGHKATPGKNYLSISPALVNATLGVRHAVFAVTRMDPATGKGTGVLVCHPGSLESLRGLAETLCPAFTHIEEPIHGYATYSIDEFQIALTPRLIVAGLSREDITEVLDRLKDPTLPSLATNSDLQECLKDRDKGLLFGYVSPALLGRVAALTQDKSRETEEAKSPFPFPLPSVSDFKAITGRLDLGKEGLALTLSAWREDDSAPSPLMALQRSPLSADALRRIPDTAPILFAIGPRAKVGEAAPSQTASANPFEQVFQILSSLEESYLYLTPQEGNPMPAVVVSLGSSSPKELRDRLLSIITPFAGGQLPTPSDQNVAGNTVRSYVLNPMISLHVTEVGSKLLLSTSLPALTDAIQGPPAGHSIAESKSFDPILSRFGKDTTAVFLIQPGRLAGILRTFVPESGREKLDAVLPLLQESALGLVTGHQGPKLSMALALTGVPDVSGLLSNLLTEKVKADMADRQVKTALEQKDWAKAIELLDSRLSTDPKNTDLLRQKFNALALQEDKKKEALEAGDVLKASIESDAKALNNLAWELLTEERYSARFGEFALSLAKKANELTHDEEWRFLDTQARAEFETGNVQNAIELQKKAIEVSRSKAPGMEEMEKSLARFQAAPSDTTTAPPPAKKTSKPSKTSKKR